MVDFMADSMVEEVSMEEEEGKDLFNRLQLIKPCRILARLFLLDYSDEIIYYQEVYFLLGKKHCRIH